MKKSILFLFITFTLNAAFAQKFEEEIEIEKLHRASHSATVFNQIAQNYSNLNQLDSSFYYSKQALKLAKQGKLNEEISKAHLYSAIIFQKKGQYFEANNQFEKAIEFAKNDSLLAFIYQQLGTCYKDQKLLEKGLEFTNKSLEIAQKKNYKTIWALCLNSIGLTHFRQQDYYEKALRTFHEALTVANQTDNDMIKSAILKNIGWVHLLWEEEEEGLAYVNKAIEIQTKSNQAVVRQNLFYSYMVLLQYEYFTKKNPKGSIEFCNKALEIAEKYNWIEEKSEVYKYLYFNHKKLGSEAKALVFYEKHVELLEKLNADKILTQKDNLDEKAKNDKLESENQLKERQRNWLIVSLLGAFLLVSTIIYLNRKLRKQNHQIEEINHNLERKIDERTQDLQSALSEIKEAILKGQTLERKRVAAELHDNLGSLLSAVSVSLDVVDTSHLSKQEQFIFENVQNQLDDAYREVRLLSHNLQPAELEKEGLERALTRLVEKINLTNKLHFSLDLADLTPMSKEIEFNLYSICLELTNNILKHSGATEASISFFKNADNQFVMQINDNGNGNKNMIEKGFGLKNIEQRIEQINAKMSVKNQNGMVYEIMIHS